MSTQSAKATPRERPILFRPKLVAKILRGEKTQTRRVARLPVRIQLPEEVAGDWPIGHTTRAPAGIYSVTMNPQGAVCVRATDGKDLGIKPGEFEWMCPYGGPGDRLWVRESWARINTPRGLRVCYRATEPAEIALAVACFGGWKPSIHMPRVACRLVLEITAVRAEPLQAITEEDAVAEGVPRGPGMAMPDGESYDPRVIFREGWDGINAKRGFGWAANPVVWALTFKVVGEEARRG